MKNLFINHKATLSAALNQMHDERVKLLLVGTQEKLEGVLSIGDIQRALIRNTTLGSSISQIYRTNPIVLNIESKEHEIRQTMLEIRAEYMPIVDSNKVVHKIIFWEDINEGTPIPPSVNINLPVVIMAGGKGTRLRPITNVLPKPLIPLGEKPIIETIMDKFTHIGSNNFYLTVNFNSELIKYYFGQLNHPDYNINYVDETAPLGTAGSLHLLQGKIDSTFFVSNCDIVIDQDYSEIYNFHKQGDFEITLVGVLKKQTISYGVLQTDDQGRLTGMEEKPETSYLINAGVYVLEPHLLDEIPKNEFFHITHLIEKVKNRNGKVGVFPVDENYWKDIGEWDEYLKNKSS